MNYKKDNLNLLEKLQKDCYAQTIHDVDFMVKPIPDPRDCTPLDPRVYEWRSAAAKAGNPLAEYERTPVELVRQMDPHPSFDITEGEISVEKQMISTRNGDTPIYIFKPKGGREIKPMLLYIHGGAYIAGSTEEEIPFCKLVAEEADVILVGVDYRLAPEYQFPIGLQDCYDAFCWMADHAEEIGGNPNFLAVGGDSAGGTLTLGVTMLEQEEVDQGRLPKNRVSYQALIYPAVLVDNPRLPDYRWRALDYEIDDNDTLTLGAAFSLAALTGEMPLLYCGRDGHILDPLASPLCAENLSYLPKTFIAVCEYDYLRLQGEAFIRKLKREGVVCRPFLYRGMDHEFINRVGYCPQAWDVAVEIAKDFKSEEEK